MEDDHRSANTICSREVFTRATPRISRLILEFVLDFASLALSSHDFLHVYRGYRCRTVPEQFAVQNFTSNIDDELNGDKTRETAEKDPKEGRS
jgi:hypothetical protein